MADKLPGQFFAVDFLLELPTRPETGLIEAAAAAAVVVLPAVIIIAVDDPINLSPVQGSSPAIRQGRRRGLVILVKVMRRGNQLKK